MNSKAKIDSLLRQGLIKEYPIDRKTIENLLGRAQIDLKTARRNIGDDPECAYTYAYTAMLRSGQALIISKGYWPSIKNKHMTIVQFTGIFLAKNHDDLIDDFDAMRKKRHRLVYEPAMPCSTTEARDAITKAEILLGIIRRLIES